MKRVLYPPSGLNSGCHEQDLGQHTTDLFEARYTHTERIIIYLPLKKPMSWLSGLWRTSRPSYRNMPDEESGSGESESLLGRGHKKVKHFWDGFVDFAFQDDILKIAVGLM